MRTKTRDTSEYGYHYVSGLLRMEAHRNITAIGRNTGVAGQNMQHFVSKSTWSGMALISEVQSEVRYHPEFEKEAIVVFDESADVKAGEVTAGVGRQYNGRLGKVENSQVGVFASLVTPRVNLWIDGELFAPEHWFEAAYAEQRAKVGVPKDRVFQTKPQLAWTIMQRLVTNGIPFQAVAMDDLYGRNHVLRTHLHEAGIEYYADVPATTVIYRDKPQVTYEKTGQKGRTRRIITAKHRYEVRDLATSTDLERATLTLRPNERGMLCAEFARCRVWVLYGDTPRQEWLLLRRTGKQTTYVLSNAALNTSLDTMAWRKSHRYFIERSNQDAKSELGWDEFQATKYQAWQHQLALTVLASWFIADTRLRWMTQFARDPALLTQYETDVLPLLSVANVRTLLRAAMPLPQLTKDQAIDLVIEHLVNRTRSRRSRLAKFTPQSRDPTSEM